MPVFSPPTVNDLPAILPDTTGLHRRLFRHYGGRPRGRTVIRSGATFVTVDTPYAEDLDGLVESVDYFLGGHIYLIDSSTADDLIAAGYDVDVEGTWGSHTGETWGSLQDQPWGGM